MAVVLCRPSRRRARLTSPYERTDPNGEPLRPDAGTFPQGERGVDQGGVVPAALIGTFSYGMLAPWSAMALVIQESACWVSTR